jgi:hypothetical protein
MGMKLKKKKSLLIIGIFLLVVLIIMGPIYLVKFRPEEVDYNKSRKTPEWIGIIEFGIILASMKKQVPSMGGFMKKSGYLKKNIRECISILLL